MEVRYIHFGTGNRVGDMIYLNKNLKKYPKLHRAILKHERKHSGRFKWKDIMLDIQNNEIRKVKREYYSFLFKHPKAFANFLPVLKIDGYWCYDISLICVWAFAIVEFIILWMILT